MRKFQILLALDGSKDSECATRLSWELARHNKLAILAQNVVDTKIARSLFACGEPGLVGSGLYAQGYESLRNSLLSIAENVCEKYHALASADRGVETESVIDEGEPLTEVLIRAEKSLLVVTGKSCAAGHQDDRAKPSLSEQLAETCPVPLLLVSPEIDVSSTLKILVSAEQLDLRYVHECVKFAQKVGKDFELIVIYTPTSNTDVCLEIGRRLRQEIPEVRNVKFKLRVLDGTQPDMVSLWKHCNCNLNINVSQSALMVVPTRLVDQKRMTIFGIAAGDFVRRTLKSSALFWPEDFVMPEDAPAVEFSKTGVEALKV